MSTTKPFVAKNLDDLVAAFVDHLGHDSLLAYCREYEVETNFDSTVDDDWPDETDRCATELLGAMVKSYEVEKQTAFAIISELHKAIIHLGGDHRIQSLTGSYRDTLDDDEVLWFLQEWNKEASQP